MKVILIIVGVSGAVVLFIAFLLGLIWLLARRLARRALAEVAAKFPRERIRLICPNANFIGIQSRGKGQLRGNGTLVLLDDRIYFLMWVPRREHEISLAAVTGTEIVNSHLGKSFFRPLVRVLFRNEQGEADSVAWLTDNAERWKNEIDSSLSAANRR